MGMPALERGPWSFYLNKAYHSEIVANVSRQVIFQLKDSIAYFSQWSVVASSDGTTFSNIGAGGDVDHWDDASDVVGSKSWVILENSVTGEQLLIDAHNSNTEFCTLHWSVTGDFGTNGTATSPPTATEYVELLNGALSDSTLASMVMHAMCSADGKSTRILWAGRYSSDYGGNVLFLEELANPPDEWISTHKRCANFVSLWRDGDYPLTRGPVFSDYGEGTQNDWDIYWKDAEPSEGHYIARANLPKTRFLDAGDVAMGTYDIQNNWRYLGEDGFSASPISILRQNSEKGGGKGRLQDLYWAPPMLPSWTTVDSTGSREWFKMGCFLVPWDGSTKPLDPA